MPAIRVDRLGPLIGQLIALEQDLVQGTPVWIEGYLADGSLVQAPLAALSTIELNGQRTLCFMFAQPTTVPTNGAQPDDQGDEA